ncbi:MAG TPA: DUF1810 domain-containing protein [Intrasporangium sp.]|nr:DUF1810 domain-containing protein [Intrasporangium sp.]
MTEDLYDLERFVSAQDSNGTYPRALDEVRAGRKRGHWMWFIFPQVAGLGRSAMAQAYALSGAAEARAYLAHPVLGPRLRESADALLNLENTDAEEVLGGIDAVKLRSSMTLFEACADDERDATLFGTVLGNFFAGNRDGKTLRILGLPTGSCESADGDRA